MADDNWGHCRNCRYFGSPASQPLGSEEARCKQPDLEQFELRVFGSSGCNAWELRPGVSEEAEFPWRQSQEAELPTY